MTKPQDTARPRNRKRALRQAFVATVATAGAIAATGCFAVTSNPPFPNDNCPAEMPASDDDCFEADLECNYTDFCDQTITFTCDGAGWESTAQGTCNPPPAPRCPDDEPPSGEICPEVGMNCHYTDQFCGVEIEARCTIDGWEVDQIACNPPPAECPQDVPTVGTVCEAQPNTIDQYPSWCAYAAETPCGTQTQVLGCLWDDLTQETTWTLQEAPTCQAQPEQCQTYGSSALCQADPGCAWQVPGCDVGGAPAATAGCYPSADCTVSGCGAWGTCETVTIDPCWDSLCDACGGEANVCVPN